MSSASVAVTRPSRSRTRRYARFERDRNHAVASRHQREDDERREREAPVEEEEHDAVPTRRSEFWTRLEIAVRHELVERLDVVRDAADDRAGAVALVVAEREALEVRKSWMRRSASARSPTQPVKYVCAPESANAATPAATNATTTAVSVSRSPSAMPSSTASFARYGGRSATSV